MKKRKIFLISGLILFGVWIGISLGNINDQRKNITKIPKESGSMIAMYVQDEEGNYNLSDAQKFPTDGYVLNTEKSSCKNGGKITQNPSTKALSLKVKTSDECTVYFDVVKGPLVGEAAKTILAKANDQSITDYDSGNKQEMFVFDHPEATQTTEWTEEERRDYRYIGNQPNNYITFNDEIWRIIGVFTVETETGDKEQLIKIIRNESIGDLYWNSNDKNEWSESILSNLLNEEYYNKESFSYKDNYSVVFTFNNKGLKQSTQGMVAKVKWYLGGSSTTSC